MSIFIRTFSIPPARRQSGFTLIELLVVIGIIIAIIGITIPAMRYAKDAAKKAATLHTMAMIDDGLHGYFMDFGIYPPSQPEPNFGFSSSANLDRGSVMLAEGLAGYLDYTYDGAGPSRPTGPDEPYGFRTKQGGFGKPYGPYVTISPKTWKVDSSDPNKQWLIDAYGNEILYYRSTKSKNATKVFDTLANTANTLFIIDDNSAATNADKSTISDPSATPISQSKFWAGIGTKSNFLNTGVVAARDTYLLISAGPDGIFFNDDDVISSR